MTLLRALEAKETDRLLALSDGVIAIAITLLVLDLSVPTTATGDPTSAVPRLVVRQWPELVGFVLSFWVIALYWMLHRRVFIHLQVHERGVVVLSLLFLQFVAFIPYATALFTNYPNQFGVSVLAGVLAATGLSLALLWGYASRRDLVEEGLSSRAVAIQSLRFTASPVVFVGSIVVAAFDPTLAVLSWFLLLPINGVLQSRLVDAMVEDESGTEDAADSHER